MDMDEEQDPFDELTSRLDVGGYPEAEIRARSYLGDEMYDKIQIYNDASNSIALQLNYNMAQEFEARGKLWESLAGAVGVATIGGILLILRRVLS